MLAIFIVPDGASKEQWERQKGEKEGGGDEMR